MSLTTLLFQTNQDVKADRVSKLAASCFYVTELITMNLRCAFSPCYGTRYEMAWMILGAIQLLINVICIYFIVSEIKVRIPYSTFAVYLGILIVDILLSAKTTSAIAVMQIFLDLAGYFVLLRFWHNVRAYSAANSVLESSEIPVFLVLHILFTFSILGCAIARARTCDSFSALDSIGAQLEVLLLGYLAAIVDASYTQASLDA